MIYGVLPSDYTLFVTQLGRTVCTVLAGKPEEKDKEPEDMGAVCAAWESVFSVIADVMYLYEERTNGGNVRLHSLFSFLDAEMKFSAKDSRAKLSARSSQPTRATGR